MLLDAGKELALLLHHLGLEAVVHQVKHLVADAGADQPSQPGARQGHESQSDERVQRDLHDQRLGHAGGQEDGASRAAEHARCDGEEELDAATAEAELEEGVPVQVRLW